MVQHAETTHSNNITQIVEQIHAAPQRIVFEFAGAGSLALWRLHSVGGSSRTLLEATDRYSAAALRDLLGRQPETFVSLPTAFEMARQAYRRAAALQERVLTPGTPAAPLLGLACTASIATDRARRGDHRCVVAVQQATGSTAYALTLTKGQRNRKGEETLVSQLILRALVRGCGLDVSVPLDLSGEEAVEEHTHPASDPLSRLLRGEAQHVTVRPDGRRAADEPLHGVLLSGAFNPLHEGHTQLAAAAADLLDLPMWFELPIVNADKGTLHAEEVERRLRQFAGRHRVVLSRVPLFSEKARLFPGSVFVVGYDTAVRLVNPRYYGGDEGLRAALEQIRAAGCSFLVAGRLADDRFLTLADITLPPGYENLFTELPEEHFRVDISSTELRAEAG